MYVHLRKKNFGNITTISSNIHKLNNYDMPKDIAMLLQFIECHGSSDTFNVVFSFLFVFPSQSSTFSNIQKYFQPDIFQIFEKNWSRLWNLLTELNQSFSEFLLPNA